MAGNLSLPHGHDERPADGPAPGRPARRSYRGLIWIFWVAVMLVVLTRFTSLSELVTALTHAKWSWVSLAVGLHLVYLYGFAVMYRVGFDTVRVQCRVAEFLPVYLASNVANAFAPSGGAAATALFVADARARGQSGIRTALGVVMVTIADLLSLVPFLLGGILFLHGRHLLRSYELAGAGVFAFFIVGLGAVLAGARFAPGAVEKLLRSMGRVANAVGHRLPRGVQLNEASATRTASQAKEAAAAIAANPLKMALAVAIALVLQLLNVVMLLFLFYAFDQPVSVGALAAGYGLGIVFFVVSFVPQGIAFVEGMMALVFTSLGYPGHKVAAIVLAFRGLNYWLPVVVGLPFLRRLSPARLQKALRPRADDELPSLPPSLDAPREASGDGPQVPA